MRLNSKTILEHQSLTSLDIPVELLTFNNMSVNQRKRMVAPASSCCCLEIIIASFAGSIGFIVMCGIVVYCFCKDSESSSQEVSVTTMPIAARETSPTQPEVTVIDIRADYEKSAESSQDGSSSPGYAGDM